MGLAPAPQYPERVGNTYEVKVGQNVTRRGPLRFEEGVATDTDVPNDFTTGVMQGYTTAPGRPNHNKSVYIKPPEETMAQRAHVGSAAWVEGPTFLGEFAAGSNEVPQTYLQRNMSGGRYERLNPANVPD